MAYESEPPNQFSTPHADDSPIAGLSQDNAAARLHGCLRMQEVLLGIGDRFTRAEADDFDAAIAEALEGLGRFARVSSCYLFECDVFQESASKLYEWRGDAAPSTREAFSRVTAESMHTLFPRAVSGAAMRVDDVAKLTDVSLPERSHFERWSIRAFLAVPVTIRSGVVGLLGFDQHDTPRAWTDDELLMLRLAAAMFAQLLDRRGKHDRLMFHISNAPLGVIEWDEQWRVRRWSGMAERIFGWSAGEVMGKAWGEWRFVHEDDVGHVRQLTDRLVGGEVSSNTSVNRNHTRDGRVVICEWFNSVLRDRMGRVRSVLTFVRDVTERENMAEQLRLSRAALEEANAQLERRVAWRTGQLTHIIEQSNEYSRALRESESLYRTLAEHATDMISTHDAEGRFTYLSPACHRLLGYEPRELLGRLPRVIAHPDDRDAVIKSLVRLRASRHEVVSTTFRARRKDGSYMWLESHSRNDGGEIVVVSRDITDRLATEQRLRLIQSAVDQVRESVVITDADLDAPGPSILYINPAFTAMTGYTLDDVRGKSPRILQGPKTDPTLLKQLRRGLERHQEFSGETVNYRKDGGEYVVEWNISALRDEQGRTLNWVAIQRDVTARKIAEQLALAHREELAHVTRLSTMGEMASGLAHELNQPLTAIHNYLSGTIQRLHARTMPRPDLIEALEHVADQAERAGQIIRRLRAFVLKRGTVRAAEDLNHLVHEAVALAEADTREHGTRIELRLPADLPKVYVDGVQIEQVLLNLIRNAIEAMDQQPAGTRRLRVETAAEGDSWVRASVVDEGPGLNASQRDHLFDPFFTTKSQGMGMGLTISHSIAEAHEGRLWVEENDGAGCTFHLRLPIVPQPAPQPGTAAKRRAVS